MAARNAMNFGPVAEPSAVAQCMVEINTLQMSSYTLNTCRVVVEYDSFMEL